MNNWLDNYDDKEMAKKARKISKGTRIPRVPKSRLETEDRLGFPVDESDLPVPGVPVNFDILMNMHKFKVPNPDYYEQQPMMIAADGGPIGPEEEQKPGVARVMGVDKEGTPVLRPTTGYYLPEVEIFADAPDTYNNYIRNKYKDAGLGVTMFGMPLDYAFGFPQAAMTKAFTGKYQLPSEAMGIENPVVALLTDAALDPVNITGAGLLTKEKALAALTSSKESGMLSNAYKYNPWAFKPNPEAGYRMIGGKEGYLDAIVSGEIRPTGRYEHAHFNIGQPLNPNRLSPEELIQAGSPGGYKGPYMAEMKEGTWQRMSDAFPNNPEMQEQFRLLGKDKDVWQHPLLGHIKVDDPRLKLYKQDWLRGYKEVPKKEVGGYVTDEYKKVRSTVPRVSYTEPSNMYTGPTTQRGITFAEGGEVERPTGTYVESMCGPDHVEIKDEKGVPVECISPEEYERRLKPFNDAAQARLEEARKNDPNPSGNPKVSWNPAIDGPYPRIKRYNEPLESNFSSYCPDCSAAEKKAMRQYERSQRRLQTNQGRNMRRAERQNFFDNIGNINLRIPPLGIGAFFQNLWDACRPGERCFKFEDGGPTNPPDKTWELNPNTYDTPNRITFPLIGGIDWSTKGSQGAGGDRAMVLGYEREGFGSNLSPFVDLNAGIASAPSSYKYTTYDSGVGQSQAELPAGAGVFGKVGFKPSFSVGQSWIHPKTGKDKYKSSFFIEPSVYADINAGKILPKEQSEYSSVMNPAENPSMTMLERNDKLLDKPWYATVNPGASLDFSKTGRVGYMDSKGSLGLTYDQYGPGVKASVIGENFEGSLPYGVKFHAGYQPGDKGRGFYGGTEILIPIGESWNKVRRKKQTPTPLPGTVSTPRFEDGGPIKPFVTSNLSEYNKRKAAYADSLDLYNRFKNSKADYYNFIKSQGFDPSRIEEWTTDGYVNTDVHPKIGATSYGILTNSGGGYNRDAAGNPINYTTYPTISSTGIRSSRNVPDNSELNKKIRKSAGASSFGYAVYEKPVQEVILSRPDMKPMTPIGFSQYEPQLQQWKGPIPQMVSGIDETIMMPSGVEISKKQFIKQYGEPAWNRATNKKADGGPTGPGDPTPKPKPEPTSWLDYINPMNWGVSNLDDAGTFEQAFAKADKENMDEFMWYGTRYPVVYAETPNKQEMSYQKEYPMTYALASGLQKLDRYKEYKPEEFMDMLGMIRQVESRDANIAQSGGGPGRGYYQFEPTSAKTAYKRAKTLASELKDLTGVEVKLPKKFDENFMNLDKDTQSFYTLSNLVKAATARREVDPNYKFNPREAGNAWFDLHWAGESSHPEDVPVRIKHWNTTHPKNLINRVAKNKKKDGGTIDDFINNL